MAGEYTRLILAAQADQDTAHRQQAMSRIAVIAPHCGGNNAGVDAMAAPVLAQLYPQPQPQPDGQLDTIKAAARAIVAGDPDRARAIPRGAAP